VQRDPIKSVMEADSHLAPCAKRKFNHDLKCRTRRRNVEGIKVLDAELIALGIKPPKRPISAWARCGRSTALPATPSAAQR
jgi:hypothetical protein